MGKGWWMMAGLMSCSMLGESIGLYEDDEGELVEVGPGLEALLGLERSVSKAMVAGERSLVTHGQSALVHAAALAAGSELSLILRDRFTRRFKWR